MIDTELIFEITHKVRLRQDVILIYYKNIINTIRLNESIDTDDEQELENHRSLYKMNTSKKNRWRNWR